MDVLYGVVHGCTVVNLFGVSQNKHLKPSSGMLESLTTLPSSSRVGVETFIEADNLELNVHLRGLHFEARLPGPPLIYPPVLYWDTVVSHCTRLRHEVVFLEQKDLFFRYNQLQIDILKLKYELDALRHLRSEYGQVLSEEETREIKYLRRELFRRNILARKIHEIDRDDILLSAVKSLDLDAAIVGLGHTDYWVANRSLDFEEYHVDINDQGMALMQHAKPDPRQVYERECLARQFRFTENGRVVDEKDPDFVGFWDSTDPANGYFEMFIDKRLPDGTVSGVIEDFLGSAVFTGNLSDISFKFVKRYVRCGMEAVTKDINYDGRLSDGKFCGRYFIGDSRNFGTPFVMVESAKLDPFEFYAN